MLNVFDQIYECKKALNAVRIIDRSEFIDMQINF